MSGSPHTNALINETSPYLLQHAGNPVQWYPWGGEALERARREDKPILLSIGYSACHWCHVMAHESFEDEDTAALMNEHFINIKVDREERPDIDKIYQTAQQLLTRRTGGWPLTMFLTPDDHLPFFGGTYFPPESRHGLPGFRDLLQRVAGFYREQHQAICDQNRSMQEALRQLEAPAAPADSYNAEPLHGAVAVLAGIFDSQHGGVGGAPKFPHPSNLDLLLSYHGAAGIHREDEAAKTLDMLRFTLEKMALGGIYDHLGGGFCRYSVDAIWMIPHFEKMLYDNGPLLSLYTRAWRVTSDPLFREAANETADWVLREMQDPQGGYYSSLDADSEGEEGKYYVWTQEEVRSLLADEEFDAMGRRFGLDRRANFEGHWHLHVFQPVDAVAAAMEKDAGEIRSLLDSARVKLLAAREHRVRPGRDEKVLTSWNALMIRGMANASLQLGREDLFESAERALGFIRSTLWRGGRLLATSKDGTAHLDAYLDDYAFLIDGILDLLACRWNGEYLSFAVELADVLLRDFEDGGNGGFFFTSHEHEKLIQRRKDFMDDALPAGNGVAAQALARLGHLLGESRYLESAERTVRAAWEPMQRIPHAHTAMLTALVELLDPPAQVIVRAPAEELPAWQQVCIESIGTRGRAYCIPDDIATLPGLLAERRSQGNPVAYVCRGFQCSAPVTRPAALTAALSPPKPG